MAPPILTLVLAALAAGLASLSFAGDLACNTLSEGRLAALAEGTSERSVRFQRLLRDRERILSRWLSTRVIAIALAAVLLADLSQGAFTRLLISVGGILVLYGILAEVLGTIARRRPETMALFVLKVLRPAEWLTFVVADPIAAIGRFVARRIPEESKLDPRITETEVSYAVDAGERSGAIANEPAEMIRNVLELKDLTVRDVMVSRKRVSAVELTTPLKAVMHMVTHDGHSRYPVFRDTLDNIVGLLYAKDLFAMAAKPEQEQGTLNDMIRKPALIVVEFQSALSVLREMRSRRQHLAIVSDEFGGTEGIVTLEDILEEIVGEIRDEYDTDAVIHELAEGRYIVDAAIPLADLAQHLGTDLASADDDVESLGGLLVHKTGKVPTIGEIVSIGDYRFVIKEADDAHVIKVEVIRSSGRPRLSRPDDERAN
jgi:putative hemolysin